MAYRVCVSFIPQYYNLDDPEKAGKGHVHAEYPKASGGFSELFKLVFTTVLGHRAPNISVVVEDMTGFGCYRSIRHNKSDLTPIPIGYPIEDFDNVNPVQVLHEGALDILSTYKTENKVEVEYADILQNSLKSFDITTWSMVFMTFLTFVVLLRLRKCLNSLREDKKQGNDLDDSPIFETFSHLIGQDSSNFLDRPGRLFSFIMTLTFFLVTITYYLNLMSTDLVVENKPYVVRNYRDIMDKNYTAGFLAGMSDVKEFENAYPKTIQEEFFKRMKNRVVKVDLGKDMMAALTNTLKVMKQEEAFLMTSMMSTSVRAMVCKYKNAMVEAFPVFSRTYTWSSNDPEGKQHTTGHIIRQGLATPLITKGLRRLRKLFESQVGKITIAKGISSFDLGPIMSGKNDFYSTLRCLSDTIIYNSSVVESVTVQNLKRLHLLCILMLISAFAALSFEVYTKHRTTAQETSL